MTRDRGAGPVVLVGLVAAALVTIAAQFLGARERQYTLTTDDPQTVYVTSGAAVRRLAGAYDALAADLYWIRAIQYYGGTKRGLAIAPQGFGKSKAPTNDYHELYALLDITTTLDPRFNIAYRFGAVFLGEPYPNGAGRPDLAIKLLEKGVRERPERWEYLQDIGFVHYWYRHDYIAAAAAFAKAAQVPGAPWFLKSLAATTLAEGGDRRSSRLMWESIRASAENDWLRNDADRRLKQLRALDDIDALDDVVRRFAGQTGARPATWAPLVRANHWPGVPVDPEGVPYEILPDGRVSVSADSPLVPMPQEPQKNAVPPSPR